MSKPSALVVFYSRSGTTRRLAGMIAEAFGAEQVEIVDRRGHGGVVGLIRGIIESLSRRASPIEALGKDPALYDLVLVGTPMWAGRMASPVRAMLAGQRGRLVSVAFFCTAGGASKAQGLFDEMAAVANAAPLATLAVSARDFAHEHTCRKVAAFVAKVSRARRNPPGADS